MVRTVRVVDTVKGESGRDYGAPFMYMFEPFHNKIIRKGEGRELKYATDAKLVSFLNGLGFS